jgi:hypothetical protein
VLVVVKAVILKLGRAVFGGTDTSWGSRWLRLRRRVAPFEAILLVFCPMYTLYN